MVCLYLNGAVCAGIRSLNGEQRRALQQNGRPSFAPFYRIMGWGDGLTAVAKPPPHPTSDKRENKGFEVFQT